jgi:hypothetical protein
VKNLVQGEACGLTDTCNGRSKSPPWYQIEPHRRVSGSGLVNLDQGFETGSIFGKVNPQ